MHETRVRDVEVWTHDLCTLCSTLCAGLPSPDVNSCGKTSVPTRLMPQVKTELAIAAVRAS